MQRAFSQACENNKQPIAELLLKYFADKKTVLEIGSGTGQHAVHFAQQLSHLQWQPSDQQEYLAGVNAWRDWAISELQLGNLLAPHCLDVSKPWDIAPAEAIFSANTLHIMSWENVEHFFAALEQQLSPGGCLCIYGPFNYQGQFTSDSNARFDLWLKERDPLSGIRNFEAVQGLAAAQGLSLIADTAMPANNRCLVWSKPRE